MYECQILTVFKLYVLKIASNFERRCCWGVDKMRIRTDGSGPEWRMRTRDAQPLGTQMRGDIY